jgi:hypothetical protein
MRIKCFKIGIVCNTLLRTITQSSLYHYKNTTYCTSICLYYFDFEIKKKSLMMISQAEVS